MRKKNVWIVGASSGIGEALAKEMDRPEYRLILSARRAKELEKVASGLKTEAVCLPMDVLQFEGHAQLVEEIGSKWGDVDILIYVAGKGQRTAFMETGAKDFQLLMDINFNAFVSVVRQVVPGMISRKSGAVVAVNSIQGKIAIPSRTAYVASKHALLGFMNSLRLELHACGIHVLSVLPAYVRTEFSLRALKKAEEVCQGIDPNHLKGVTPQTVAKKTFRALRKGSLEIHPGRFSQVAGVYLHKILPYKIFYWILRKKFR